MKRGIHIYIIGVIMLLAAVISCNNDPVTFPVTESPDLPLAENAAATLLWIGPDYKVAVAATLKDDEGISEVRFKNGEWQLDTLLTIDNKTSYAVTDTFLVSKDINKTQHFIEMVITNSEGGIIKRSVEVEDLSDENQIEGYEADLLPPVIEVFKPEITKFYGLDGEPVNIEVDASITDLEIASLEVRIWGETAEGESFMQEDIITPSTDEEKKSYLYNRTFTLPIGKVGEYQYIVKSTDVRGNKTVKGDLITVGYMDRLYLSDAETEDEVINQGYDHYGAARGIGTLLSMRKQGTNVFITEFYYPNETTDNIRFVALLGDDRPFISNQATVNYTLDGFNVLAQSASEPGKLTTDLTGANFKLPVNQKGYYRITVDMTARTISVSPFTPTRDFSDPVKYPDWSDDNPWEYMAVTGGAVVGTGGWTETATSPKLMKEDGNKYRYTGTFQTSGSSSNISFNSPLAVSGDNVWGEGWFRMTAGRGDMKDDYGDPISIVGAVGPSGGGANWGFSTSPAGTYKATYDIALERLRLVRIGN